MQDAKKYYKFDYIYHKVNLLSPIKTLQLNMPLGFAKWMAIFN